MVQFLGLALTLVLAAGCSRELLAQSDDGPTAPATVTGNVVPRPDSSASIASPVAVPSSIPASLATSRCREQQAQPNLVAAHLNRAATSPEDRREQLRLRAASIAYRTKNYGRFAPFGRAEDHQLHPKQLAEATSFFGIPVMLNRRIIPALQCVEAQIRTECARTPYQPQILSGLRHKNTYFDGEVSNHVYGIALDVDPVRNPCCRCLSPWKDSPRCRGDKTVWERMDMPKCWVDVFERYGFYWLGHDPLEDTMHFEFLGDPERIELPRAAASRVTSIP